LNNLLGAGSIWEDITFGVIAALLALVAIFKAEWMVSSSHLPGRFC